MVVGALTALFVALVAARWLKTTFANTTENMVQYFLDKKEEMKLDLTQFNQAVQMALDVFPSH